MKNMLLRAARRKKGWTQRQLADFTALSVATIERAERGESISVETLQRLYTCFQKTPEQLGLLHEMQENQASPVPTKSQGHGLVSAGIPIRTTRQDVLERVEAEQRPGVSPGSALTFKQTKPPASSLADVVQLQQTVFFEQAPDEHGVFQPSESGFLKPLNPSIQTLPLTVAQIDLPTWFGIQVNDLKAIGASWQESKVTRQQQQTFIHAELEKWNVMANEDDQPTNEYLITRRTALATLSTLSSSLLAKVQLGPLTTFVIEEFLAQCTTSITTCWHLMQGRELAIVQQTLMRYLPVLCSWARQSSSYQKTSAYLAAQGCLLMGLLSLHSFPVPHSFQKRALYCTQATEYASISADPCLQIIALAHLGNAQYDMGQRDTMLQTYQKALSTLDDLSKQYQFPSLLRSKLQIELAHAYAQHGHVQQSLRALEEARVLFPNDRETTPVFLSTDYGYHSLILFEGLTHLDLEKYAPANNHSHQATVALSQIESISLNEPIPERFRVEIINQQALAAIREGNLDNFRSYLLEGAKGAKTLASQKRRQEAIANWKEARARWPHEKQIWELADVLME